MQKKSTQLKDPLVIALHLLLSGIVILFLAFTYSYVFSENQDKWIVFKLPKILWFNTVIILSISVCVQRLLHFYDKDDSRKMKKFFFFSLCLALLFIALQFVAFSQLHQIGITLQSSPSSSYMYLIAMVHGLHILVGLILLIAGILRLNKVMRDQVQSLVYFSDPIRRSRLVLLCHYWHTIDFLWLFLFLVFLYMHA